LVEAPLWNRDYGQIGYCGIECGIHQLAEVIPAALISNVNFSSVNGDCWRICDLIRGEVYRTMAAVLVIDCHHGQMSGLAIKLKGAILMGHSESGFYPEQAALINPTDIKGLITIETVCPALSAEQISSLAKIPTLVVFGDHIEDVTAYPNIWKDRFDSCAKFVQQVNASGGDATMMHLPKYGQFGNSHMLMQDKNNLKVADLILKWIDEHVESKQKRGGQHP